jgi:hypothetical protein
MSEQPKDSYEEPAVEQLDSEDQPSVVAAGDVTDVPG